MTGAAMGAGAGAVARAMPRATAVLIGAEEGRPC
jgi:hypothetical protein